MALLFAIYPGFLSQPNAIDYQSHIIALALALFSLALTVKAFYTPDLPKRMSILGLSALCGWAYLGLMEYYIGFELIRLLLVLLLTLRGNEDRWARWKKMVPYWLLAAFVPGLFIFWRVFLFTGDRKATDAGSQLSPFLASPAQTILHWLFGLFNDMWDVLINAWSIPLTQLLPKLSLFQILTGLGLGSLAVLGFLMLIKRSVQDNTDWRVETLWLGISAVVAGLIPVILANREVSFPEFSRYTLISSTGAVMTITALIFWLSSDALRKSLLSILILVAMLTHYSNSVKAARETESLDSFWWQAAWRIPQLEPHATLVAHYPVVNIEEDYFVWGPANLIYYPEKLVEGDIQPEVYAIVPNSDAVQKVVAREPQVYDNRRTIITYANYRNILILTQPGLNSCVQVMDGSQPELSTHETQNFITMAPYSEIDHILPEAESHMPPSIVFGSEPPHGWCFYYEKASLARQREEWDRVIAIGKEAFGKGLEPKDLIEWMPFLQAYAIQADVNRLTELAPKILADPFIAQQACSVLQKMKGISQSTLNSIDRLYCVPGSK
jgi:hypothetical protein